MNYKDILVYIDDGASNVERINTAFNMAKSTEARITAVTPAALVPEHLKVKDPTAVANLSEKAAQERLEAFSAQAEAAGLEFGKHLIRAGEDATVKKIAQFARNFDLVIMRQSNPKRRNVDLVEKMAESILLYSGRPVFFMPYIGAHHVPFKKAMIAWDGSPTANRAIHDVLPLLEQVPEVMLLVITGKSKTARGELLVDTMASHLQRHGVNASVYRQSAGTFDVPTLILNEIAENGVDLLVMGGYGTPSLQQKIFGGVTRTLLSSMIVPVVMSH